jgi:predicted HTH transcriptional regulator
MKSHSLKKGKIVKFIKENRVVTSSELARFLKVSWNTAEKYLLELVIEEQIVRIKKLGVNLWLLK